MRLSRLTALASACALSLACRDSRGGVSGDPAGAAQAPGLHGQAPGESGAQAAEAWRAALERVVSRAALPDVPKTAASDRQRPALDDARRLRGILALDPGDLQSARALGEALEKALYPEAALAAAAHVLQHAPEDAHALALAGRCLLASGPTEDGEQLLARALEVAPDTRSARWALVQALGKRGDVERAGAIARAGLERSPNDALLLIAVGVAERAAGKLAEARAHFERAATLDPESLQAHYQLAQVLDELGQHAAAEAQRAVHTRLARIDDLGLPDGATRWHKVSALACSYARSGEHERALVEIESLLAERFDADLAASWAANAAKLGAPVAAARTAALERAYPHLAGRLGAAQPAGE